MIVDTEAKRKLREMNATDLLFCFNVCSTGSAVFFRSVG